MKVTVVSATPKQLDSVGAWQTMMPSSVAASVSMSSTPTVYLATTRSRCEACMIRRVIGVWRMEVPIRATVSRAASTTASSSERRGNCQSRLPKTSSQPRPSSAAMVSGGSSRGAKTRIFGLDMDTPRLVWIVAMVVRCARWKARRSFELDAAVPEGLLPAHRFLAEEGIELLRRAAGRVDAGFLQPSVERRIRIHRRHFLLNLVDDGARRASGRHEGDPARNVVERRHAGSDRERLQVGQRRKRAAVELGQGAEPSGLDQRQAGSHTVDDIVDRAGQEALHDLGAAFVGDE